MSGTSLLPVTKQYRAKFNWQKKRQRIPDNTCPIINSVVADLLGTTAAARTRARKRLEQVRKANSQLRQIGVDWYELCRDLLDELELTQKLYEKKPKDGYSRRQNKTKMLNES